MFSKEIELQLGIRDTLFVFFSLQCFGLRLDVCIGEVFHVGTFETCGTKKYWVVIGLVHTKIITVQAE